MEPKTQFFTNKLPKSSGFSQTVCVLVTVCVTSIKPDRCIFYGRIVHSSVLCCFIKAYIERDCVDKQVYSAFTMCFLLSSACNTAKNRLCAEIISSAALLRSHTRCERCNLLKEHASFVCCGHRMCEKVWNRLPMMGWVSPTITQYIIQVLYLCMHPRGIKPMTLVFLKPCITYF